MTKSRNEEPFKYSYEYPKKWFHIVRFGFKLKAFWRWFRVQKPVTRLMGYQYQVADDLIEIDITYSVT